MAIIIPHQLSLAPPPVPPPVFSGPLPNPQRSAFLFPAVRFFISSNLLSRFLRSAILFPLACSFVSFVSLACSFWSVFLFPLFRFFVSFGPLLRSLCSVFLFPLFRFFVSFGPLLPFFRTPLLFSSARFPVSFGPHLRSLCSVSSFLSVRSFVSFVPLLPFFCTPLLFSLFCFFVSFGPLLRFLRSVSCSFWSGSTRHCLVVSSFPSLSSLSFCQLFSPLSNPTHALQHSRRCSSTFETTPFLPQDHALQRSRTRPSPHVSVCAWFRVSCKFRFASFPPPCVVTFVCVLVKFFHTPKRLVGSFLSHRFSQMNRSLSAHRGNSQTSASRRQISQNLHPS